MSQRPCRAGTCRRLLQQVSLRDAIDDASDGQKITVAPGARWCAGSSRRERQTPRSRPLPHPTPAGTYWGDSNTNLVLGDKKITLVAAAGPEGTTIDCRGADGCRIFNVTGDGGKTATIQGEQHKAAAGRGRLALTSVGHIKVLRVQSAAISAARRCPAGTAAPSAQVGFPPTHPALPAPCTGFRMLAGNSSLGGCAYIKDASPAFIKCRFENCRARHAEAGLGGAMYVEGAAANPKLQVSGKLLEFAG